MTVKELIELLQKEDPDAPVYRSTVGKSPVDEIDGVSRTTVNPSKTAAVLIE